MTRPLARRRDVGALAAVLVVGAVFSQRSADPMVADPAASAALRAQIDERAAAAQVALGALREAIAAAVEAGRRAAALTIAGTELPGASFRSAGSRLRGAERLLAPASVAVARLRGSLVIAVPSAALGAAVLELRPGELSATGALLTSAGPAADAFVVMRRATDATLTKLSAALGFLSTGDPSGALTALADASDQLAIVGAWPGALETLPIWTDTTAALIAALRALARAEVAHDAAAARAAQRAYQAAADDGQRADRALAIAIADGASAIASGALRSAADELAAVDRALDEGAATR